MRAVMAGMRSSRSKSVLAGRRRFVRSIVPYSARICVIASSHPLPTLSLRGSGFSESREEQAPMARRDGGCYDPHELSPASIRRSLFLLALLLAVPACGVSFRSEFKGTEVFKSISVSGQRVVGSELTLNVEVAQPYPVPVQVSCYFENQDDLTEDQKMVAFQERAAKVGETVLPANVGSAPQDKVDKQKLSFTFKPATPGDYFAACITPGAPDNGYGMSFTVKAR